MHFSETPKINGKFRFIKINYSSKRGVDEPLDGFIEYDGRTFYFMYHADFDEGNTYLVYQNEIPVMWFSLAYPYVNPDNGNPVHDPDEFVEDDRDFEDGSFQKWHVD